MGRAPLRPIVYDSPKPAMLDIGFQELLVVMVIALLVFGPEKLPELGRRLGRAMREFRRASDDFRSTIETNLHFNEESILPPSASPSVAAEPAAGDGLPAPGGGAGTAVGESAALEPADGPKGLTPEVVAGPFDEVEAAGVELLPRDPFCAQRGGRLLHRSMCAWVERMPEAERIAIKTAAEGWEQGLKACPACDPQEPAS